MPYSDPEIHLFFVLNTDTREWRRILINTLPSVRKRIVRPSADVDRMHFLRDDRASLFINVVENKEMIIIQPRNWNHKEMACFRVWLTKE
jgi:hypothetical protein